MSRRHNTKHRRSPSHYPDRLRDRGESSATVRMRDYGIDIRHKTPRTDRKDGAR